MKKREIDQIINRWLEEEKISYEQAQYMLADVAAITSEKSGRKFISTIMYIGATALSLGALLLIASNWSELAKGVKLILALLLPILPLCFAYWQLIVRGENKVLGRAANILSLALVGGSLSLIGQIYHLEAGSNSLLWTWVLLTTPFVFIFQKKENVLFSAVLIGFSILFSLFDFFDKANIDESTSVLLLTITSLFYAFLLYSIGGALRYASSWLSSGRVMRIFGAGLAATTLFFTTFEFYARIITDSSGYRSSGGEWMPVSIVLNLVFIGFLVFSLVRATKYEEYSFAFSILRLFGLYLLVKYCTLFYSMFDTGLFFMVGGILFIVGGWLLEKNKNTLLLYMKDTLR